VNRLSAFLIGLSTISAGVILFFFTRISSPYHIFGILLIIAGAMVTTRLHGGVAGSKAANAYALAYERQWQNFKHTWPAGALIIGILALSVYLLHIDATSGGICPVLFFMASGFLAMGYMIYLLGPQRN
jgi:hypothetical protein